jgi:hypothetical protein
VRVLTTAAAAALPSTTSSYVVGNAFVVLTLCSRANYMPDIEGGEVVTPLTNAEQIRIEEHSAAQQCDSGSNHAVEHRPMPPILFGEKHKCEGCHPHEVHEFDDDQHQCLATAQAIRAV